MISYPALPDTDDEVVEDDKMKSTDKQLSGTPPPEYTEKNRDEKLFTITQPHATEKKPSPAPPTVAVVTKRPNACTFNTAWKVVVTVLFILVLTSVLFLATLYIKACGQCMAPRNDESHNRLPARGYPLPLPQLNSETDNSVDGPSGTQLPPFPSPPCGGGMMGPFQPPPQFPMPPPMPCFPHDGFPPLPLPPPPMIFFPPPPPHFVEFLFPGMPPSQQSLVEKPNFEKGDGPFLPRPPPHLFPFLPMPRMITEESGKNGTERLVARRNRRLKFRKLKRRLNTSDCCDNPSS